MDLAAWTPRALSVLLDQFWGFRGSPWTFRSQAKAACGSLTARATLAGGRAFQAGTKGNPRRRKPDRDRWNYNSLDCGPFGPPPPGPHGPRTCAM